MSTTTRCQAKNPATCPYHGQPTNTNSLKDRVKALTQGKPVFFSSFSEKGKELTGTVVIKPRSNAVKQDPIYIDLKGDSFEDIQNLLGTTLKGLKLKEYKTGYEAEIVLPNSDNKDAVSSKFYASTERQRFDDESITDDGIPGFKQAIMYEMASQTVNNKKFEAVINEIKDSKVAQSVSGAKAIAVIESMNEFKYFHLRDNRDSYEVESAFKTVLDQTREYTNRGYGIRVHMDYKNNGELRQARFSLDDPESKWSSFSKKQVNAVNAKLEKYFASFDN